jgi:hypothetical protein
MRVNSLPNFKEFGVIDQLIIPSDGTIGSVESRVDAFFRESREEPEHLELDLSMCDYIEVSSLIHFIAFIKSRLNRGLYTYLRIPKSESVRDFLRVWEFPRALRQATGIPFHKFVPPADHRYFGEHQDESNRRYSGWVLDRQVDRLLSDRFFAITTFPINQSTSHARLVVDETERWEAQLVKSVLKKHLIGPEGYFANRVIFESMTNALRHPSANIIQTVSRFDVRYDSSGKTTGSKHFTMAFWDDGESIITTLKRAIDSGLTVRSADVPELYSNYRVTLENSEGKKGEPQIIPSSFLPDEKTSEELLLLAATFPGITRDVVGIDHLAPADMLDSEKSLMLPGMGLYVLTNCVVDIFGGTIAFRTKDFFMNIKQTSDWLQKKGDQSRYQVKIKKFSQNSPSFLGNMLTIRLPLREQNAPG